MVRHTILLLSLLVVACNQQQKPEPARPEVPSKAPAAEDTTFNRKIRCVELKPTLQKENPAFLIDEVFYSTKLDTCVVTKRFIQKNATIFAIEDALTGASIFVDRNINGKSLDEIMR